MPIKKTTKTETIEYYDFFEMRDLINEKYAIDQDDYAGCHSYSKTKTDEYNLGYNGTFYKRGTIFGEYIAYMEFKGYDLNTWKDSQGNCWLNSIELSSERSQAIKDGIWSMAPDVPYWNFWHFMLDYWIDFEKGVPLQLNWVDVKEEATEDWQREIADMYIMEFGEEDYTVIVYF
jgi:hypothetical protein